MPIVLTSAHTPGGLYTDAHIINFALDAAGKEIKLTVIYANTLNGVLVPASENPRTFIITGAAYDTLVAKMAAENITIYDAAAIELYQWLVDNGHYPGTIS